MLILFKQNILINLKTQNQQFKIANKKQKKINSKQFVLDFIKYSTIYTIVCASVTKILNKKLAKSKIFKELRDLKDIYNNKLTKILSKLRKKDYAIKFLKQ